ncbi:MAG: hypothetical protein A2284_11990 [Deltaproteobacteria bacterium RIFOXYA12_FULL_61_11]|nr:MAG: hypothetical protein A2284_11990 [Deltaproteobacteria bacterium RIFOXYA12_FULL_61_11]
MQAFSLEQLGSVTLPLSVVPSLLIPASALPSNPRVEHGYQLIGLEPSVGKMQHKHQTIESDATYLVALLIVREADGAVHKVRCRHLDQTVALREGLYLFCPLSGELTAPTLDVLVFSTTYRNFLQLSLGEEPLLFLKDKVDLAGQPNRTPTLNLAQHYQAYPGVETFLTVAAEDEDQDALFLSVEGLPSFAEQLHQYLVFAPTSAAVGQTSTFTVSVRDNGNPSLTVSAEVKVEVVAPPRLPASGLKTCYDETTTRECAEIAARYPAQEAAKGAPPRALEQAEGGILHDGDTGLRWAVKQVETEATQHAAAMICKALVTESGEQWRLPSRRELLSVASFGAENTLLGLALEKDPSTDQAWFWTSEVLVTDKADFWAVRFHPVGIESADADRPGAVLCVAGAPWAARRQGSFQRNVSNTAVLDRDWGLEWQVDNKAERKTWAGAFEYCAGLELDGKTGWRVPGIRELESILQLEQDPNPFDAAAFLEFSLAASAPVFWTSTTEASRPDTAWTISMEDGTLIPQRKTAFGSVCCVR